MKKMIWGQDPEFSGPRNWFRESLIIRSVSKNKKSGRVLDFGCGSGSLLLRICQKNYTGLGIDISKYAISFANHTAREKHLTKKITFRIGSIATLKGKSPGAFDIIVSGETLEHIKNDQEVVTAFFKLLKKNGVCVVSVPAHPEQWDINDNFSSHFRRYTKKELEKLFSDAGFKKINSFYWGYPLSYYWHKYIYLPMIENKMNQNKKYTGSPGILGILLSQDVMKSLFSLPFWVDQIFNWTQKGGGLILIARKD